MDRTQAADDQRAVWVASDLAADQNSYVLAIHFNDDLSHVLDGQQAVDYAQAVLEASAVAAYEAAIFAQLTRKVKLSAPAVANLLAKLRADRGKHQWSAGPMTLTPGVSVFTGEPFLTCRVGTMEWQWSSGDADQHAQHVVASIPVVSLDTAYLRYLVEEHGSEVALATTVVGDLGNFRSSSRRQPPT